MDGVTSATSLRLLLALSFVAVVMAEFEMSDLGCHNCVFAQAKTGTDMVSCGVDLPPHVAFHVGYRKQLIHKNYWCALHRVAPKKKDK